MCNIVSQLEFNYETRSKPAHPYATIPTECCVEEALQQDLFNREFKKSANVQEFSENQNLSESHLLSAPSGNPYARMQVGSEGKPKKRVLPMAEYIRKLRVIFLGYQSKGLIIHGNKRLMPMFLKLIEEAKKVRKYSRHDVVEAFSRYRLPNNPEFRPVFNRETVNQVEREARRILQQFR